MLVKLLWSNIDSFIFVSNIFFFHLYTASIDYPPRHTPPPSFLSSYKLHQHQRHSPRQDDEMSAVSNDSVDIETSSFSSSDTKKEKKSKVGALNRFKFQFLTNFSEIRKVFAREFDNCYLI